jgi:Tfp pilus assembly protein PilP
MTSKQIFAVVPDYLLIACSLFWFSVTSAKAETVTDTPSSRESPKVYNPEGKSDPFKPAIMISDSVVEAITLVSFDTRDIRLVGTALGTELSALLMINNKGVIAKVGDKIGRTGGRIISISKDRIIVRQPIIATGGAARRTKTMQHRYEDTIIRVADSAVPSTQDKSTTGSEMNTSGLEMQPKSTTLSPSLPAATDESQAQQYDFSKKYSAPNAGAGTENR